MLVVSCDFVVPLTSLLGITGGAAVRKSGYLRLKRGADSGSQQPEQGAFRQPDTARALKSAVMRSP
jgi:hypothetical protein